MASHDFLDETLMAYADGAVDADTAQAVASAAEADEEVARRIAVFRNTGALLAQARSARTDPPVPDALLARVHKTLEARREAPAPEDRTVVQFGPIARAPRWAPMAAAASVALVVGLGAGLLLRPALSPDTSPARLVSLAASGVAGALSQLESGGSAPVVSGELSIIASFRTPEGAFCREFELASGGESTVGVACAEGEEWDLRFAVANGASDAEGFAPAGALESLDAWLVGIGAGAPLAPSEEREALRGLSD